MKIVFTGGGTGGHFYPIVAVASALKNILDTNNVEADLYYMAPEKYDASELERSYLVYQYVPAGKRRRYFSFRNVIDLFITGIGVVVALWRLFVMYPDVVFAKGAYGSFPVLLAARILFIPVVIHESDSAPGRVTAWASKFAARIAVSYSQAAEHFPKDRVAYTGQPIREVTNAPSREAARKYFDIPANERVVCVLGGSQGAQHINDVIINGLQTFLSRMWLIHQSGEGNKQEVAETANALIGDSGELADRYILRGHMDHAELSHAAAAADIVVSRAGSTIFEIATWRIPSIIIPIASSNNDHQRSNAYAYARTGAAVVIEEDNLTSNILHSEITRILDTKEVYTKMSESTEAFVKHDAADTIARELYHIAESHR